MNPLPGLAREGARFGDFVVQACLHQSGHSLVLRCLRGGRSVVVKFLARPSPGARDVARFRREFALSRRIVHPGVVSAESIGQHGGAMYIVMPDDGAVALRELLHAGPLAIADAVHVALAVVDALEAVHGCRMVHKDIGPGNVIADLASGLVKLIDFGIAAEISSERAEAARPQDLEGTLAYMAPEQSGRMNREVDYRTDFYGLGATLFALLAGSPPFPFDDPVKAVHAHLALPPAELLPLRPDVPPVLAALVARLLAKTPEARYQSHAALRRDLRFIQAHLEQPDSLARYTLAADDLPPHFQVAGDLHGRAEEQRVLLEAFEAAVQGPAQLVSIAGVSGIGKTALVGAVRTALLGYRGNFVAGKFNQFGQHTPYAAFLQALQERVHQVLAQSPAEQLGWKQALGASLGHDAAVVLDLLPELGRLLEGVPPALPLAPAEAESRTLRALQQCFAALAGAAEPLVVFIDDLQWADRASRRLLRRMVQEEGLRHLLWVVAYRSDEVTPDHPLAADLRAYAEAGPRVHALQVGPLGLAECTQWIAQSLLRTPEDVLPLARLCHAKTGGNPFFLRRFLEEAATRQLIWLDPVQACWSWSTEGIARERMADNVVMLMVAQLRRLPVATARLMTIAACLGSRFEISDLAHASETATESVLDHLGPALEAGMLVPVDGRFRWFQMLEPAERIGMRVGLSFVHDRVQEAAYALADPADRPALHLRIGRLLRAGVDLARPAFAVVNHLNQGAALIHDEDERRALAGLNAQASRAAQDASAFDMAADLAQRTLALQGDSWWARAPQAALAWHVHAARMAYLADQAVRMEELLQRALPHARGAADQAELLGVRVEALFAAGDLDGVLGAGLQALALLDVQLPQVQGPQDVVQLITAVHGEIQAMGLPVLSAHAPMVDAASLQKLGITARMTAAAYIARPALLPLLTVLQVRLMVAQGHAPVAMSAYSVMGLMVAEFMGDIAFGYRLGRMSVEVVEREGWRQVQSHAGFSFNAFLRHWMEPITQGLPALLEVHASGVEVGNLRHAGLGLYLHGCHAFLGGMALPELAPQLERHAAALQRIRQPVALDYVNVLREMVRALQAPALEARALESAQLSMQQLAQTYAARSDQTGAMFLHAFACMQHALAGRLAEAEAEGAAAEALFSAGRGMLMVPFCLYFATNAALAMACGADPADDVQQRRRAHAASVMPRFERWARHSVDMAPLWHLLRASVAGSAGDRETVRDEHRAAVALLGALDNALVHGMVHAHRAQWLALLSEPGAAAAQSDAQAAWRAWGAVALAPERGRMVRMPVAGEVHTATLPDTQQMAGGMLDLSTLLRAVQAVTSEIALEPLLSRLLQVLLESAGAQRAAVVLRDGTGWRLHADSAAPGEAAAGTVRPSLEDAEALLPLPVVRTALNTSVAVQVRHVHEDARWRLLPYFQALPGGSVACLPLLKLGEVVGALYLENTILVDAFSSRRMEFLGLLSGNVVNAIDNARLVQQLREQADTLEQRVAQRTRELHESEARTLSILQNAPMPMTVTRRGDGRLVYVNAPAAALGGLAPDGLEGQLAVSLFRDPAERDRMYALYRAKGVLHNHEVHLQRPDGQPIWALVSLVPIVYDGEAADLATIIDITERKSMEETLRRLATTDALTGVSNRGEFMRRAAVELGRARRYGRPLSIVLLDVDHFKQINDRFGHSGGDEALRVLSHACAALVRQQDLLGRLGGEEFGILMPETDADAAVLLAQRVRQHLAALVVDLPGAGPLRMSASFGVAALGDDDDSLERLIVRADEALYRSKRAGRDRVSAG